MSFSSCQVTSSTPTGNIRNQQRSHFFFFFPRVGCTIYRAGTAITKQSPHSCKALHLRLWERGY